MSNPTRRDVLKTLAVTGSAVALPFGAQAVGKNPGLASSSATSLKPLPLYIDVQLGQTRAKQQTVIVNHGDRPLTVTGFNPASFKSVNGQVTVNVKTPALPYTLQPGESLPVYAEAVSTSSSRTSLPVVPTIASERIAIRTRDASINGELVISVFDSQVA